MKSNILSQTVGAILVAIGAAIIAIMSHYQMGMFVSIVGFMISLFCIFAVRVSKSALQRGSMVFFMAAYLGVLISSKVGAASAGVLLSAMVATGLLVALAAMLYSHFSAMSLAVFSLVGLIGLIVLSLFGVHGTWMSAAGVIIYFACLMYDFHTIGEVPNAETGTMSLLVSIVGLFTNILDLAD
jgi:FtsH-binding integral membrane protein